LPGAKANEALSDYHWYGRLSGILRQSNEQLQQNLSLTLADLFEQETDVENDH
jgi:hypothetical protein